MNKYSEDLLYEQTAVKIFHRLANHKEENISFISRKINVSYSWTWKVLKNMEKKGLLIFFKSGRQNIISLTIKGRKLINSYELIHNILNKRFD